MSTIVSYLEISRAAVEANLQTIKSLLAPGTKLAAVLKANAYGHGLKEMQQILAGKVDYFQLDDLEELKALRAWTNFPVLLLGYLSPAQFEEAVQLRAELAIWDQSQLAPLQKAAAKANQVVRLHLGIDTGFGREGLEPNKFESLVKELHRFPNLQLFGLYSHLADADTPASPAHTESQLQQFQAVQATASKLGYPNLLTHISATAGTLLWETNHPNALVRPGIGLYGLWPSLETKERFPDLVLQPVMRWISQVALVKTVPAGQPIGYGSTFTTTKPTTLALIPQGYSDGLDRKLSNQGTVLIKGTVCPLLGRISMNMCVADVSHLQDLQAGEEVVLLGRQGEAEIRAEEIAAKVGTINYEIIARINPLLPRIIV